MKKKRRENGELNRKKNKKGNQCDIKAENQINENEIDSV